MTYLNEFRAVSDAFDILDSRIINVGLTVDVVAHPEANKSQVAQTVIRNLTNLLQTKNMQIDQPIATADIMNSIINTESVISLIDFEVVSLTGKIEDRAYSDVSFNVGSNTIKKMIVGPPGSIFELKYPAKDIVVTVR